MLDLLIEVLAQILFEYLFSALVLLGVRGASAVMGSRAGRIVVITGLGLLGGWIWGLHATQTGLGHEPRSLWVSVALAGAACFMAARSKPRETLPSLSMTLTADDILPWRWSRGRLIGFAFLNVAIAAGILIGFRPPLR